MLLNKKAANSMFSNGHTPQGFILNGVSYAGFGSFSNLSKTFEFPLFSEIKNGKVLIKKWVFDERKIVCTFFQHGKKILTSFTTIEDLFHSNDPCVHLINRNDVLNAIANGYVFKYINKSANVIVLIENDIEKEYLISNLYEKENNTDKEYYNCYSKEISKHKNSDFFSLDFFKFGFLKKHKKI